MKAIEYARKHWDPIGDPVDPLFENFEVFDGPPHPEESQQELAVARSKLWLPASTLSPFEDIKHLDLDMLDEMESTAFRSRHVHRHSRKPSPYSASRISEHHRMQAVKYGLAYLHRQAHHYLPYTMGAGRWQCVAAARHGQLFRMGDCSSTTTAILRYALRHSGGSFVKTHRDRPNHLGYRGGYTGTLRLHGWHLAIPTRKLDQVHYGWGTGRHVALYVGGGLVLSHGSPGWHLYSYRYHGDDYSHARRTL